MNFPDAATVASLEDIQIRTEFTLGDLGYLSHLHGTLYAAEYGYGASFEAYVAAGLAEFYRNYDPARDRIWICEHEKKIIGCLALMHRAADTAQLRYYLIIPEYRGLGLGKKLMELYMEFLRHGGYTSSYLWTTAELAAAASLYVKHGFRLTEEKPSSSFGKSVIEQRYDYRVQNLPPLQRGDQEG